MARGDCPQAREFEPEEIRQDIWVPRAVEAGLPLETFCEIAEDMNRRKVIGRFSTFLEHVKPLADGERVTRFNALFHWAVPPGREIEAGKEVGRHHIMTHAYWREGGPEFRNVNVMGVAHGTNKDVVLQHKAAIDEHLRGIGIPVSYTNVFWGGRSEIKPSEISPFAYREWCISVGLDPESLREYPQPTGLDTFIDYATNLDPDRDGDSFILHPGPGGISIRRRDQTTDDGLSGQTANDRSSRRNESDGSAARAE